MSSRSASFSETALDPRILALPVGHLQFSERVRLALRDRDTVGKLISLFKSSGPRWSPLIRSEISLVLDLLIRCIRDGSAHGWDRFRRQRPKAADATAIYFTSFALDPLQDSVRSLPVGTLHPKTRVATALARAKIITIDDLIDAGIRGLVHPNPGGPGTCLEIIDMLEALSMSVEPSGKCDWARYARCGGIVLLPPRRNSTSVVTKYIEKFPSIIEAAVFVEFGQRGAVLARKSLLSPKWRRSSTEAIARELAISRQQVEALRNLIVGRLRDALLMEDYTRCCFRFRPEFVEPARVLTDELRRVRNRAIGYHEWRKILSLCSLAIPSNLAEVESGLLEILGFQLVTFKQPRLRPIILPCGREAAPFRAALTKAEQLFTLEFAAGLSRADLFDELKRTGSGRHLRQADMRAIIESLPVRRRRGTERYECRLRDIRRLRDRLHRALNDRGRPAHFRELAFMTEVPATAQQDNARVTALALAADKRFKPIGRSGFWALTEWSVETRFIADVANACLTRYGRAATEAELFQFISRQRMVSRESIGTLLSKDGRFIRVAPRTWALSCAGRCEKQCNEAECSATVTQKS